MKTDIWMPLYIGDHLRETMHLDTREHGAYLLLLMAYWANGPLPDNDAFLARIAKLSLSDWGATRYVVAPLFEITDGHWIHSRTDSEREKALKQRDAKVLGAKMTNSSRWEKAKKTSLSESHSESESVSHSDLSSPSPSQKKNICSGSDRVGANGSRFKKPTLSELELFATKIGFPLTECQTFLEYYDSNGWKVGRNPMRNWQSTLQRWKRTRDEKRGARGTERSGPPPSTAEMEEYEKVAAEERRLTDLRFSGQSKDE